jgi:hypothetical protein
LHGLAVGPGVKYASSVVTVLPITTAPASRTRGDARRVGARPRSGVDRRAVAGRQVGGVDDVLDSDRHAIEKANRGAHGPPGVELRARDRAAGSRHSQAWTTGSRRAIRSRLACTRASALPAPEANAAWAAVADLGSSAAALTNGLGGSRRGRRG